MRRSARRAGKGILVFSNFGSRVLFFDFGVIEVFWVQDWLVSLLCCMDDESFLYILQKRKTILMDQILNFPGSYLLQITELYTNLMGVAVKFMELHACSSEVYGAVEFMELAATCVEKPDVEDLSDCSVDCSVDIF
ncbi:Uncharacterized protein Rs2_13271 [Raphanus sativus]|nr:Uncharacterized protein Rs2_13271 [Raphanus sativus]